MAYDLHDGLTQYVMAAHAHLEAFRHAHDSSNEEKAQREIEKGLKYLKDAVVESRRMVNNLRLLVLDDLGLAGAIEQLVQEEKNRAGWERAEFIHDIGDERYEKTLETAVYRVAQEALTNARKHSGAQRIALSLVQDRDRYGNAFLLLEARDWGKGFEPEGHFNELEHIGLKGIIERVHLLEGTYELRSKPGQGTRLRARFPLLADAPES